jgi:hypothetical protein
VWRHCWSVKRGEALLAATAFSPAATQSRAQIRRSARDPGYAQLLLTVCNITMRGGIRQCGRRGPQVGDELRRRRDIGFFTKHNL